MKISVITPVYNAAPFLEKAVDSILIQEEVAEVILIEDGSKDDSLEICKKLERDNERVKLFQHENGVNKGPGATRNMGLNNATQDYIAFLDADDYYLPNRFAAVKNIFKTQADAEGVYEAIGTHFYSESAKKKYTKKLITTLPYSNLTKIEYFEALCLGKGFTSLDGITIKKSLIQKVGQFDEDLRQSQDMDYIMRLALGGKFFGGSIEEPVTIRGVHENNRIHDQANAILYAGKMAEKWLKLSVSNDWSTEIVYKFFYRAVVGHQNTNKRLFAIKTLLNNLTLLRKLKWMDILYGLKSNFK